MRLSDIAAGGSGLSFARLGQPDPIVAEIQTRLGLYGVLDPPSDGQFGAVSLWALGQFRERMGHTAPEIDRQLAGALLASDPATLFPLVPTTDFAGRIVKAMLARGFWVCRHPAAVNIVYVERCDLSGTEVAFKRNKFCDVRVTLTVDATGVPAIAGAWIGTTAPGRHWVEVEPMNPRGAARIVPGQYKAWSRGIHKDHDALRQTSRIMVTRDLNKDYSRTSDIAEPLDSTLNQHWGYNQPLDAIDKASAGCLVGQLKNGHREFMKIVTGDARFLANSRYQFVTAILDHSDL